MGEYILGKALYLGAYEPKVPVKIQVLKNEHGDMYAATLFKPLKEGEKGILKTFGLNDRNKYSSRQDLENALRVSWGLEIIESDE